MVENPRRIPSKPRRWLLPARLVVGLARLVLLLAVCFWLIGLLLLVAWWRLISWPQRHRTPRERSVAQREALLELFQAAGTLLASRRAR